MMSDSRTFPRRVYQRLASFARASLIMVLLAWGLGGTASVHAGAAIVQADTWITDGPVNAVARSGNTLYLGGSFTSVGPATGGFVAVDRNTGNRDVRFPQVNGSVTAIAPDGVGG